MELRQLEYFVAVAEERHFGRAAARLFVKQPSISHQVATLERELGGKLFERTSRRVALTPLGAVFLDEARRVLAQVEHAREAARRVLRGEVGALTIGCAEDAGQRALPRLLRALQAEHGAIQPVVRSMTTAEQVEALGQGRLDVGLGWLPVSAPGIHALVVQRERFMALLLRDDPLAGRASVTVQDLAVRPLVLWPREASPGLHDRVLGFFRTQGLEPRVAYTPPGLERILALVRAGLGVGVAATAMAAGRLAEDVVAVPFADPDHVAEQAVLWHEQHASPAARAFVAAAEVLARESG